jgi:hypothetical protein
MFTDKDYTVFITLAGALVPAGFRQIIGDLIENEYLNVLVSTSANMVHDMVEALGYRHKVGSFRAEDKKLKARNIGRIGDVYIEQKAFQKRVRQVYEREVGPLVEEYERKEAFPVQLYPILGAEHLLCMRCPKEYGGQGYGILENALIVESFCRRDSGIGVCLSIANFSSEIILRFGSETQKKKYLIPLAKGEAISAGAFTEPDHGSDITQMYTTAILDDDGFVINGTKTTLSVSQPLLTMSLDLEIAFGDEKILVVDFKSNSTRARVNKTYDSSPVVTVLKTK